MLPASHELHKQNLRLVSALASRCQGFAAEVRSIRVSKHIHGCRCHKLSVQSGYSGSARLVLQLVCTSPTAGSIGNVSSNPSFNSPCEDETTILLRTLAMRAGGGKGEMKALDRAPWSTKKAIKHLANGGQVCNQVHVAAWKLGLAASGRRWLRSEPQRGGCATRLPLCKTSERTKERGGLTSGRQIDVHKVQEIGSRMSQGAPGDAWPGLSFSASGASGGRRSESWDRA